MFIKNAAMIGLLTSTSFVYAAGPLGLNLGGSLNAGAAVGGSIPTLGVNLNASGDMKTSLPVLDLNGALQVDAYSKGASLSDLASITNFATTIENADGVNASVNAVTKLTSQVSTDAQSQGAKQTQAAEKPANDPKPTDSGTNASQPKAQTDQAANKRDKSQASALGSVEAVAKVASNIQGQSALEGAKKQASGSANLGSNVTGMSAVAAGKSISSVASSTSQMNGDAQVASKHVNGQLSGSNQTDVASTIQPKHQSLSAEGSSNMNGSMNIAR